MLAPQLPHWRVVSIASSGWLGRPTIWALLAPGGTIFTSTYREPGEP